jgi:hypothetical protein
MLINIKPARTGLILRDPADHYSRVPDAGKQVGYNVYWQRRINDGDAVIVDAATVTSATESTAAAATGGTA